MDKTNLLSIPMIVRSLNVKNNSFRPYENDEEVLGLEVSYLSVIEDLMYLTNSTRSDIAFVTNLLARFNSSPTRRYWNRITHVFRYLKGTIDLSLFYPKESK